MALPKIAPYLYTDTEHHNRVNWQVEPSRALLLIHDMQHYFVQAFERVHEGTPIQDAQINVAVANLRRMIDTAHRAGIPVVYTAQPPRQTPADRCLLNDFWGAGLQDDNGAQILAELAPTSSDTVLTKWRYSAFVRSPLEQRMNQLGRDQLIIGGVYAHIGCLATAQDAFMRDIEPFLVADALADFSEQKHRIACQLAAGQCARVLSTDQAVGQIIAALAHPGAAGHTTGRISACAG